MRPAKLRGAPRSSPTAGAKVVGALAVSIACVACRASEPTAPALAGRGEHGASTPSRSGAVVAPDASHTPPKRSEAVVAPDASDTPPSRSGAVAAPDASHTPPKRSGGAVAPDASDTPPSRSEAVAAPEASDTPPAKRTPPPTTTVERPVYENLMPAPIALGDRLRPCRVDFDHSFLGDDDERWEVTTAPVRSLVWDWETAGRGADWERAPVAPIPMTLAQARALRESTGNVSETTIAGAPVIFVHFADSDFSYVFDDRGRSVDVDWDPVADGDVYRFRYAYACDTGATPPAWRDERG